MFALENTYAYTLQTSFKHIYSLSKQSLFNNLLWACVWANFRSFAAVKNVEELSPPLLVYDLTGS